MLARVISNEHHIGGRSGSKAACNSEVVIRGACDGMKRGPFGESEFVEADRLEGDLPVRHREVGPGEHGHAELFCLGQKLSYVLDTMRQKLSA